MHRQLCNTLLGPAEIVKMNFLISSSKSCWVKIEEEEEEEEESLQVYSSTLEWGKVIKKGEPYSIRDHSIGIEKVSERQRARPEEKRGD